jgi:hypothetical protein
MVIEASTTATKRNGHRRAGHGPKFRPRQKNSARIMEKGEAPVTGARAAAISPSPNLHSEISFDAPLRQSY